jgi:hypothetical protein
MDEVSRDSYPRFKRPKEKESAVALAERTWDAIQSGTLDDLKMDCTSAAGLSKTKAG